MSATTAAEPDRKTQKRRRKQASQMNNNALIGQSKAMPYLFSAPAIIMVSALLAFPVLYGVWESLFRAERLGAPLEFVGFQNYVDMFADERFWSSLNKTFIFVFGTMIVGLTLGLVFAFALNRVVKRLRFLRALTLGPYIISNVAAAVMFRLVFNADFGIINRTLELFGIDGLSWLARPWLAMIVVIFAQVWTDLPLTILLLLAGLQTIDGSYNDAAMVDGATGWRRAWHLSIPLISPQIMISTVWMSYSTLTGLGVVLALTGGGPLRATETLPMNMYATAFRDLRMPEALATATFILVLNAVLTLVYFGLAKRYGTAE